MLKPVLFGSPMRKLANIFRSNATSMIAGALIIFFWLVMMGSLVKRHLPPPAIKETGKSANVDPISLISNWKDYEEFMTVNMGGKRVGGSVSSLKKLPGDSNGFRADFRFQAALSLLGISSEIKLNAAAELDPQLNLSKFGIEANLSAIKLKINGLCLGNEMLVETIRANDRTLARFVLPRRISLLDAVRPAAIRKLNLKPGFSMEIPVVDPIWSMEQGMLRITVRDEESIKIGQDSLNAFRVESKLNDYVSSNWVSPDGVTLRRQIVGSLTLDRVTEKEMRSIWPNFRETMEIPPLNPKDFSTLPLQNLQRMSDKKSSPLSVLGSLVH